MASRKANAGAFNLRQVILGTFDQRIHTTGKADTTKVFSETYKEILGIETPAGTNMPANFGHMAGGYDAQYYGYLVSYFLFYVITFRVFFLEKVSILFLMPCPFTGRKMFCAGPNFMSQPKNLTAFCLFKNFCAGTKINFTECKSSFCLAQNVCD